MELGKVWLQYTVLVEKCRLEGTVAPKYGTFYGIGNVWLQYTVLVEKCMPEGTAVRKYCTSVAQNIHFCAET